MRNSRSFRNRLACGVAAVVGATALSFGVAGPAVAATTVIQPDSASCQASRTHMAGLGYNTSNCLPMALAPSKDKRYQYTYWR